MEMEGGFDEMEGGLDFGHELNCEYCGEGFSVDQYTIEMPNGENVGTFCTKECRVAYNMYLIGPLGTDQWKERAKLFKDGRRVFPAPAPSIVRDKRKTCRSVWLPQCWKQLSNQELVIVRLEMQNRRKRKK